MVKTVNEMKWTRRNGTVQAGDYRESNVTVTEHVSEDGRFTVLPSGEMRYCRSNGWSGNLSTRWIWSGYRVTDHNPDRPSWVPSTSRRNTVRDCKRFADLRVKYEALKKEHRV